MPFFTEKQREVLREPLRPWNIYYGATRAGKSKASYYKFLEGLEAHRRHNILLAAKTLNTLERNVLGEMRKDFGDRHIGKIRSNCEVEIFGKKCFAVGANDERSITKIQGSGLGLAYCDELTTFPQNFFEMLKSRLDVKDAACIATCNPESPSHFVKQFIDNPSMAGLIYSKQFTIYDNTFLSPDFIDRLERAYRGTIYFDKWILGKWVKAEGLVFPLFKRSEHFLTEKEYAEKYNPEGLYYPSFVIFGVDGATTNDSTAIEPVAILSNGQAVRLEHFYHNPKINGQLSNEQLIPFVKQYFSDMEKKYRFQQYGTRFITVVDCAAADLVLTLSYHLPQYYNVQKYTSKNIMQTTDVVNNAFSRNAVHILNYGGYYNYVRGEFVRQDVDQLVEDLELMTWDKRNEGYDGTVPNDCADAFRDALCTYFNNIDNLYELTGKRGMYL